MTDANWPIVTQGDVDLTPSSEDGRCFHCRAGVGAPHGRECVLVQKRVRVRVTLEIEVEVPHSWTHDDVWFHHNESSWCASNIAQRIQEYVDRLDSGAADTQCLCGQCTIEVMRTSDPTPRVYSRGE